MGAVGWVVGLVAGAALTYDEDTFFPPLLTAVVTGAPVGVAGALVGAMIGANRPGERWERISLPARVSILPRRQGLALSSSVTF